MLSLSPKSQPKCRAKRRVEWRFITLTFYGRNSGATLDYPHT